jgi:hypothetical protein
MSGIIIMVSGGHPVHTDKTVDSCFILPILPHKLGNVRDFWDDVSEKYGSDIDSHFKLNGVHRVIAFLQDIPEKGDFLLMFMQSRNSLERTLHDLFASGLECSRYLTSQFMEFSGIDMSRKENFPGIELLDDWKETREYMEERGMLTMPWCFALPLKEGKASDALRFAQEARRSMASDIEGMLRHHDVLRRLAYLQHTQQGDFIVFHLLASNPLDELILAMTSCGDKMCGLARNKIMEFTGIDLSDQKNVPKVELLFKWDEAHGFETADQIIAYTE